MTTTLGFKDVIDVPTWRPAAACPITSATGVTMTSDMRNDVSCDPYIYLLTTTGTIHAYNAAMDGWSLRGSASLGSINAGSALAFNPSQGSRGTLAAGATTLKVVLSTALPAAVGINQLANNGSGLRGYRIRIIGNGTSSSGKIDERYIIANTAGTTPTLELDSALSFTPVSGDGYEILSGKLYIYGGGVTVGNFKTLDIATGFFSAALTLPATGSTGAASLIPLSELHVPNSKSPSQGFFGSLTATGIASGTITGQAASGDSGVIANQYRNFQVRVIQDTTNTTAVGQRRRIASHTAGTSPVYTLSSNWSVTPSATCQFVIENDDDKIILLHDSSTNVYNYNIAANTWDTTTWATAIARGAGAMSAQSFGIDLGSDLAVDGARHSMLYSLRGGVTTSLDVLDIAAGTTGVWSNAAAYGGLSTLFTTGDSAAYDPVSLGGKYLNINAVGAQQNYRLDLKNRVLEPMAYLRYPQGAIVAGSRMAMAYFQDGSTKLSFAYLIAQSSNAMFSIACQR